MVRSPGWPPACIEKVRELHPTGMSMAHMAKALNAMPEADRVFGKNAVVGMCHRLDLPSRPSCSLNRSYSNRTKTPPFRRAMAAAEVLAKRRVKRDRPAKPRLVVVATAPSPPPTAPLPPSEPLATPAPSPAALPTPPEPVMLEAADQPAVGMAGFGSVAAITAILQRSSSRGCQFPYGEVGQPNFRFCGKPPYRRGASWCQDCFNRVFTSRFSAELVA